MEQAIGTGEWLRMMGSLILVLVMAVGSLWLWRWLQNRGWSGGQTDRAQLRIEEAVQVGVRHKIVLLRVGSQQVVVGVSPNGMTRLAHWPRFDEELKQAQERSHD